MSFFIYQRSFGKKIVWPRWTHASVKRLRFALTESKIGYREQCDWTIDLHHHEREIK